MPLYDYRCNKCGAVFEKRRMMSATGPVACARCTSNATTKLISAPVSILNWKDSDSVHESQRFRSAVPNRQIQLQQ